MSQGEINQRRNVNGKNVSMENRNPGAEIVGDRHSVSMINGKINVENVVPVSVSMISEKNSAKNVVDRRSVSIGN